MSRLKHSRTGYLRSLQISRHQVFAFVEGTQVDPFFFGEICRRVCQPNGVGYLVRPARELPGSAGGKSAVIAFYRYARSKARLVSELGRKRTVIVFFLDKDLDDMTRKKCRSPHVIYTTYYDVQNHVFRHSDFGLAAAAAASLDRQELMAHPTFAGNWCQGAARRWREWIALCMLSVKHGVPNANYRVASQVNTPINGPLDLAKYSSAVQTLASSLGVAADVVDRRVDVLRSGIEKQLSGGTYDRVFKGKWYALLLEADLRDAFTANQHQFNGVAGRAAAVMAATMDFSQPWAESFSRPLAELVARL